MSEIKKVFGIDSLYFFFETNENYDDLFLEILDQLEEIKGKFEKRDIEFENKDLTISINDIQLSYLGKQEGFYWFKDSNEFFRIGFKDKYKNREILIQGDDITLKVDETLISMAISNLIENALKYSEDEIIVNISDNSITIIDKGIGIEEKELEKINQKFYRVSNNGWNNSLGLGLFIVQAVLSLHNFNLDISSEFKKGSKFCIKY